MVCFYMLACCVRVFVGGGSGYVGLWVRVGEYECVCGSVGGRL